MSYSGAAENGGDSDGGNENGGDGGPYADLPDEYWVLIKGRSVSSLMGIVVGVLGIRGSQSLNTQTIKMYFLGLIVCAIVAMMIRIQVFIDVVTGKVSPRTRRDVVWYKRSTSPQGFWGAGDRSLKPPEVQGGLTCVDKLCRGQDRPVHLHASQRPHHMSWLYVSHKTYLLRIFCWCCGFACPQLAQTEKATPT